MERYIGMDVHKESCTFCVLNATGKRVRQDVVETNGEALVGYLKQLSGRLHLCLEESEWAAWLWEILSPHVAELVVFRGERRKGAKSDSLDAEALAERLRTGQIDRPIFKAPKQFAKLRELAQVYQLLAVDLAGAKNRLKSRFRRRGVDCEGEEIYSFKKRRRRLRELPATMRPAAILVLMAHDRLSNQSAAAAIAGTFLLSAAASGIGSRGRHYSWIVFLAIGLIALVEAVT